MYEKHTKIDEVRQVILMLEAMKKADPIEHQRYLDFKLLTYKINCRIEQIQNTLAELQGKEGEGKQKYLNVWRVELANYQSYKTLIESGIVRQDNYYLYEMDATFETPFGTKVKRVKPFLKYF